MVCSDSLNERNNMMPAKGDDLIAPGDTVCPCDLIETSIDEDRAITRSLMRLSEKTLARILENEPDIYTVDDLKIRF
jgi:hypothetical protein